MLWIELVRSVHFTFLLFVIVGGMRWRGALLLFGVSGKSRKLSHIAPGRPPNRLVMRGRVGLRVLLVCLCVISLDLYIK
jgi:hypothetical protein